MDPSSTPAVGGASKSNGREGKVAKSSSFVQGEEFERRFKDPYATYKRQMNGHKWTSDAKENLRALGQVHRNYETRRKVEDALALVAFVGVVLAFFLDNHVWDSNDDCEDGECYSDDTAGVILKICILGDSVLCVILLTWREILTNRIKILRDIWPPGSHFIMNPKTLRMYVLEFILLFYHVPIGVDCYIDLSGVKMHVNVLNVFMLVRLYLFLAVMRNHSGFFGQQIHFIGMLNSVDTMGILFNFKMMLKQRPTMLLLPLLLGVWVTTACAVTIAERADPDANIVRFDDALYFVLITMSTVGYGDFYPVTGLGRFVVLVGGVVGGTIIATLLIAVFVDMSQTTKKEKYVINIVNKRLWHRSIRNSAAGVLQATYRRYEYAVRARMGDQNAQLHLASATRRLYTKLTEMRCKRRERPDDMTKEDINDKAYEGVSEVLAIVRGPNRREREVSHVPFIDQMKEMKRRQLDLEKLVGQLLDEVKKMKNTQS